MNFDNFKSILIQSGVSPEAYAFDHKLLCGEPLYSATPLIQNQVLPKFWLAAIQGPDIYYSVAGAVGFQEPRQWPTNAKALSRMLQGTYVCHQLSQPSKDLAFAA
jgi:hypothetical protein